MYQKSCKNGSSSHLSEESVASAMPTCNNADESAVDRLISEKAKVGMPRIMQCLQTEIFCVLFDISFYLSYYILKFLV